MGARDDLLAIPDEVLRAGGISQAVLVFMDFRDEPKRWWTGFGDLNVAGHVWQGLGDLISISRIESTYTLSVRQVTFSVAATAEMMALALAAKSRVRNRAVSISLQLFVNGGKVNGVTTGQPIGSPLSLYNGTMQRMPFGGSGSTERNIQIECEGLFFRRNQAPRGRWTDSDQKARYPGDRGFERLPIYASGYETRWRG